MFQTMMETMTNQMNKLVESNATIDSDANLIEQSADCHTEKVTTELMNSKQKLTHVQKSIQSHQEQVNILIFGYYFESCNILLIFSVNLGMPPMKRVLNRHSMMSIKNWNILKRKKSNPAAK